MSTNHITALDRAITLAEEGSEVGNTRDSQSIVLARMALNAVKDEQAAIASLKAWYVGNRATGSLETSALLATCMQLFGPRPKTGITQDDLDAQDQRCYAEYRAAKAMLRAHG